MKTSEISREAEIKEGAKKPIRSLALLWRNSVSLANLMRGELVLETELVAHFGEAQTSGAGNGARE